MQSVPSSLTTAPAGEFLSSDSIRERFARAMSAMYREEVPQYGTLLDIVAQVNAQVLGRAPASPPASLPASLPMTQAELERLGAERHGAIRVGSARELGMLRRMFAVLGMQPVGYYDLSAAGVPVHSTAFRPVEPEALARNPFRLFTSLLRLELIEDPQLRALAAQRLEQREIFSPEALRLTREFELRGGLAESQADAFVRELLQTFRWHGQATVPLETYRRMHAAHRLVADVVCFRGPHINHLTPRTLDIDAVQELMPRHGIAAKETIEGPPRRKVPILLRQTSFKALAEAVRFGDGEGPLGEHTARFGEVEQRGIALTPGGRALYDRLLREADAAAQSGAPDHAARLEQAFQAFPDDLEALRRQGLGYFEYSRVSEAIPAGVAAHDLEALVAAGAVQARPIVYEDFLPVSAAGIFQSNLGDAARGALRAADARAEFEGALGCAALDEFALYEAQQAASIERCLRGPRPVGAPPRPRGDDGVAP
ncbi:VOC family protein [Thiomonas sp. FB-6]|uniref:2-oxoadipate dioxygenase/decarboxylase HglS n=1 Tax=Thiomonas sp. FB-6 TaxID=1158291 RepID=UPI000374B300|nr:VOC family protein [Thiomonas sp. FB-6]